VATDRPRAHALLEAADAALHVAKDLGRNLVVDLEELSRDPQWQVRLV
jgi:PleD family two-component response regulator